MENLKNKIISKISMLLDKDITSQELRYIIELYKYIDMENVKIDSWVSGITDIIKALPSNDDVEDIEKKGDM